MYLKQHLIHIRRLIMRTSLMVGLLVILLITTRGIALTPVPVEIDSYERTSLVKVEFNASSSGNYYPEYCETDDRSASWIALSSYTNVYSAGRVVMFISIPATASDNVGIRVVSTDTKVLPTIFPAGVTSCPVALTTCPAKVTSCPSAAATFCAAAAVTTCPKVPTLCMGAPTVCPVAATVCPMKPNRKSNIV